MSEIQKVPWPKAKRAAQAAADNQGLDLGPKEIEVLAVLLAYHAGIEIVEDE